MPTKIIICYGFHQSRVTNCSKILQKKAYLSPLLWSWSTGRCSVWTIPCVQVKLVLGHISFPEKIAKWRMCGFLFQEEVINRLKNCPSPVLLEVINSCNIKVSFSAIHFLVFTLAFNCSFIVYSTLLKLARPISIVCFQTVRDRNNLLLLL